MSIATRIQSMEEHISDAYDSLSKFGVAAPSNKNIENIASLVDEIYDNTPKIDYVSGTDLTLENTRVGKIDFKDSDGIERIGLGATSQYTTTGKNKLNLTIENKTTGGITLTKNNDNSYKISGTSTSLLLFGSSNTQILTANTTYILGITNGNNNVQLSLRTPDGNTQYVKTEGTATYATFTPTTDIEVKLYVRIPSGVTVNETIFPMIIEGSTIGTYEPYTGGIASPNPDFPQDINVVKDNQNIIIKGRNLLNLQNGTYTNNGITANVNNGIIILNGTAGVGNSFINIPYSQTVEPKIEYTLSLNNNFTTSNTSDGLRLSTNDNTRGSFTALNRTKTFIFQDALTTNQITIRLMEGSTVNNGTLMPQLEEGNIATSYVPHQENNYEINLSSKNLFNVNGEWFNINNTIPTITNNVLKQVNRGSYSRTEWVINNLNANQNYVLKCNYSNPSGSSIQIRILRKNNSTSIVQSDVSTNTSGTFEITATIPEDTCYIRLYSNTTETSNNYTVEFSNIQLEVGSTATSYAPYFTPIELCKMGDYQDYLFKQNNKWYKYNAIQKRIFDGSEDWAKSSTTALDKFFLDVYNDTLPTNNQAKSTHFIYGSSSSTVLGIFGMGYTTSRNATSIFINYSGYNTTTLAQFKTWLASNRPIFYYVLKTPTITEITNTTLISELNNLYNAQSGKGTTYIKVYGDLPMQLKVRALSK